jgi:hypothetical protein
MTAHLPASTSAGLHERYVWQPSANLPRQPQRRPPHARAWGKLGFRRYDERRELLTRRGRVLRTRAPREHVVPGLVETEVAVSHLRLPDW